MQWDYAERTAATTVREARRGTDSDAWKEQLWQSVPLVDQVPSYLHEHRNDIFAFVSRSDM
jgi:hypothetical protein